MDHSNNYSNCSISLDCNNISRDMKGMFEVIAILRIIMSTFSILGAFSIVGSATYRRTMCNPKVHPIFMLSIVDMMVSVMWITGSSVWLAKVPIHTNTTAVCFSINIVTVILQCVAMNVTLIYALLAYSSLKQKDFSGVYNIMGNGQTQYVHVWRPVRSFVTYSVAWMFPTVLILTLFTVHSLKYSLVSRATTCSCWCLPYYGNVIPRPRLGYKTNTYDRNYYIHHLHFYVATYSIVLCLNFAVVFLTMSFLYFRAFQRIRRMRQAQEQNDNTTAIHCATRAMIVEGENDAKKRVFLFLSIFFVTQLPRTAAIVIYVKDLKTQYTPYDLKTHQKIVIGIYVFFVCEALLVPLQGFLNAIAYGWTRGDFLSVMSSNQNLKSFSETLSHSYGSINRRSSTTRRDQECEDDDKEDSQPIQCRSRWRRDAIMDGDRMAVTPGTPQY